MPSNTDAPLVPASEHDYDRVVHEINRIVTQKGLETARLLGSYLLATFFDDDPALLHSRSPKVASFRKLAERDDLQCTFTFLWKSVAVVEQLRLLPGEVAEALPITHHRLLLPVKDPEAKVALAREAVSVRLSARDLEARVRSAKDLERRGEKRGRKPTPQHVLAATRFGRVLAQLTEEALPDDFLRRLDEDDRQALRERLDATLARLTTFRASL